jgi:histidinol-phosphate aminotransferase
MTGDRMSNDIPPSPVQIGPEPRPELAKMKPYKAGRGVDESRKETGFTGRIVKLAQNEGTLGLTPAAALAVAAELETSASRYPESGFPKLRAALAAHHGVNSDNILVGAGGTVVLDHLSSAFLTPGSEVVTSEPTFGWYAKYAQKMGAVSRSVGLTADGASDLDAILAQVNDRTRFVYVCSPNNPTGAIVTRQELTTFLDALPDHVLAIVDEAYADYVEDPDYHDAAEYVRAGRPVVVVRTFSKIYGLAGLRVGYLIGPASVLTECAKLQNPYEVNRAAVAAALASLGETEEIARRKAENTKMRAHLRAELEALGLRVLPSEANFLHLEVGDGAAMASALERRGIIVRPLGPMGDPASIRVTLSVQDEMDAFLAAIKAVLGEQLAKGQAALPA